MSGVKWIEAEGFLVVILPKKAPKTIKVSSPIYKDVKKSVKAEDVDKLLELLFPEEAVETKSSGSVKMDSKGSLTIEGKKVDSALARMVKDFTSEGIDFRPLINLQKNIEKNENEWIREQLFRFLERNRVSLTDDGCFICYKGVTRKDNGDLVDCHSGRFLNNVGCCPEMPRNQVDLDPHRTCSAGLHVAAYDYVHGIYSGKVYIVVKIHPKDVCSVPYDYSDQKMRVCRYEVIAMMGDEKQMEHIYYPWDKSHLKEKTKKTEAKKKVQKSQKRTWVDLSKPPASVTIQCVLNLTGKIIPISQKSKVRVIKYALDYLSAEGFKTKGKSKVEIPIEALAESCNKGVSIYGMSSRQIVDYVQETIGEKIKINLKSKARIVDAAVSLFAQYGYYVDM